MLKKFNLIIIIQRGKVHNLRSIVNCLMKAKLLLNTLSNSHFELYSLSLQFNNCTCVIFKLLSNSSFHLNFNLFSNSCWPIPWPSFLSCFFLLKDPWFGQAKQSEQLAERHKILHRLRNYDGTLINLQLTSFHRQ